MCNACIIPLIIDALNDVTCTIMMDVSGWFVCQMPLCDSQTMLILLIVLLLYALNPISMDLVSDKTHGRRPVNDIFLLVLLVLGITALIDNCPVR